MNCRYRAAAGVVAPNKNSVRSQGAPWAALIICGTRYGPVRLTVADVECQFVSASGTLVLIDWNNQDVATLDGLLDPGPWGLRAWLGPRRGQSPRVVDG